MTEELLQEKATLSARWREIKNIEEEEKENLVLPELKIKYENTYWRFLNSYGNNDVWYLYICVEKVTGAALIDKEWRPETSGWSFQTDSNGQISIDCKDMSLGGHLMQEEVTQVQFLDEYQILLGRLRELPNRTNPMNGAIATSAT